jgi:O-antigen/teichoic acid export membrane protein
VTHRETVSSSDSAAGKSYADAAVRGSAWTSLQVATSKAAAATATFCLGFLLEPSDFGVAWFAISAGGLATGLHVLAAMDVLLASPRGFQRMAGPVQRMAAATAGAELAVVAALGLVLSRTYPERSGLLVLMLVVAVRPLTDAANVLPMARLRLGLEYRRLAALDAVTTLTGSIGAISMAYFGCGPLSIVLPPIACTGLRAALYWAQTGPIVTTWSAGRRSRALWRRFLLATFGSYVSGVLLILDNVILGLFVSPGSLGLFAFASGLATQINAIVSYQIAGSLHPIFAHLRNDPERQIEGLMRACRLIASLLVPILLVQAAIGGPVFRLVWGERWADSVPILMTISVAQCFIVGQWPASFTLKAQGRFRGYLKLQLLQVVTAAVTGSIVAALGGPKAMSVTAWLGFPCSEQASVPLAVAANGVLLLAIFGPLTLWLACKPARITPLAVVDVIARPWITGAPVAVISGVIARAAEHSDLGRGAKITMVVGMGAVAVAVGGLASIALHASTRQDARLLAKRLPGFTR